jgi:hypothetical protein
MFHFKNNLPMSNLISAAFSTDDEKGTMELLAQLKAKFPFGIKFSPDQRKHQPKLYDGRLPFVEKALAFGRQQPLIVPPYTDLNELEKDLDFVKATRRVGTEIASLAEMVADSRVAAGSDAYSAALAIYNSAKAAAKQGVPGTQSIVDELGKLFEGQGSGTTPNESATK